MSAIKLDDFFERVEAEKEGIAFTLERINVPDEVIAKFEVRDDQTKSFLSKLRSITPAQDAIIMSQLDAVASKNNVSVLSIKPAMI